jgi:hypothetical protein
MSATPDPDWAAANPQRSAQTATVMLILDILDIVGGGGGGSCGGGGGSPRTCVGVGRGQVFGVSLEEEEMEEVPWW